MNTTGLAITIFRKIRRKYGQECDDPEMRRGIIKMVNSLLAHPGPLSIKLSALWKLIRGGKELDKLEDALFRAYLDGSRAFCDAEDTRRAAIRREFLEVYGRLWRDYHALATQLRNNLAFRCLPITASESLTTPLKSPEKVTEFFDRIDGISARTA